MAFSFVLTCLIRMRIFVLKADIGTSFKRNLMPARIYRKQRSTIDNANHREGLSVPNKFKKTSDIEGFFN